MGIYKPHCPHKAKDKCACPWYLRVQRKGRRFVIPANEFAKKPVLTRDEANRQQTLFEAEILGDRWKSPLKPTTVKDLVDAYLLLHMAAHKQDDPAKKGRLNQIVEKWGTRQIGSIGVMEVEHFLQDLRKAGKAEQTVKHYYVVINHLLSWATLRGFIAEHPLQKAGIPIITFNKIENGRERRLRSGEEERLLGVANPQMKLRIIGALDTGARRGEMLKVRVQDIDLDRNELTLRAGTTKNKDARRIPLTPRLRALLEFRIEGMRGDQYPFGDEAGLAISEFRAEWDEVRGLANIDHFDSGGWDLHWHDLRHEFCSRLAATGIDLFTFMQLSGHKTPSMAQRYVHLRTESLHEAIGQMGQQTEQTARAKETTVQ